MSNTWSCANCGHNKMDYLPTRQRHACAKCFELVPGFLPGLEDVDIPTPTKEDTDEVGRDMIEWASRSEKDRAVVLYVEGHFKTPALAAQSIGYEWSAEDQAEHERNTYVAPEKLDKLYKMMEAVRDARKEGRYA